MKKNKKLAQGTLFLVPLRDSEFSPGVLAYRNGKGCAFGYFFAERISDADIARRIEFDPKKAILVGFFNEIEMTRGIWPIVGLVDSWCPRDWPILPLSRTDMESGRAWLSIYGDDLSLIKEIEINSSEAKKYHQDLMMGPGSVELRLTRQLANLNG